MDMNKLNNYTLQKQTPHPLQHLQEWVLFLFFFRFVHFQQQF